MKRLGYKGIGIGILLLVIAILSTILSFSVMQHEFEKTSSPAATEAP